MLEFLTKFEFLNKIFKLGETRHTARERLRLVLIHDRASVSPQVMESLKEDLIAIISKYLEIDISALEIGLEKKDGSIALAANIPIKRVRRLKETDPQESSETMVSSTGTEGSGTAQATMCHDSTLLTPQIGKTVQDQGITKTRSLRKKRATSKSRRKSKIHGQSPKK